MRPAVASATIEPTMGSTGTLPIGGVVADRYRIVRSMATGGMGEVYEAEHDELRVRVALKVLQREQAAIPEAVERFLREARAAASLGSEHVAKVFDVGRTADGAPYLAMELLEGDDLERVLEKRGPLPVHEAVTYIVEALQALVEAHARGIVHRDLKPSNLFLARSGDRTKVKILDFGISKLEQGLEAPQVSLTSTRSMLGSPGYMSPEQVRSSKNVDARTDIWSIGVILYELLSGSQAFVGETLGDVFAKIREEPLPSIRTVRADVPHALEQILARCLERDRMLRYASAAELLEALRPYASPSGAEAARTTFVARDSRSSAHHAITVQTRTDWSTRFPQTGRKTAPLLAILGVAAALGVGGAVLLYRSLGPTSATGAVATPTPPVDPPAADRATASAPSPEGNRGSEAARPDVATSAEPVASGSPASPPSAKVPAAAVKPPPSAVVPRSAASVRPQATDPKPPSYDPDDLGI